MLKAGTNERADTALPTEEGDEQRVEEY
jgi:hypothetical protein